MKNPQPHPQLFCDCLRLITRGLHDSLSNSTDPAVRERAIEAATTLIDLLKKAVKP